MYPETAALLPITLQGGQAALTQTPTKYVMGDEVATAEQGCVRLPHRNTDQPEIQQQPLERGL